MKGKKAVRKAILIIAIVFIIAFFVFPFVWLVIQSFQTTQTLMKRPPRILPAEDIFINYRAIFFGELHGIYKFSVPSAIYYITPAFINSLIISTISSVSILLLGALCAYSIAVVRFRGSERLALSTIFLRTLPATAVIIPLFATMRFLNLINTHAGLIMIYIGTTLPYSLWILVTYFQTIPRDIVDAAKVDGCSTIQSLFRIVLPLSTPGLTTAFLFSFLLCWNEFFIALVLTSSPQAFTLPVVISMFTANPQMTPYDLMITSGVVGAVPPIIIALAFQKYIIKGLTAGAMKG